MDTHPKPRGWNLPRASIKSYPIGTRIIRGKQLPDGSIRQYETIKTERGLMDYGRYLIEQRIGRRLHGAKERVVRRNGDPLDNRDENLLFYSPWDHVNSRWSEQYDCCIVCGTRDRAVPYEARGYCRPCWKQSPYGEAQRERFRRNRKPKQRERDGPVPIVSSPQGDQQNEAPPQGGSQPALQRLDVPVLDGSQDDGAV